MRWLGLVVAVLAMLAGCAVVPMGSSPMPGAWASHDPEDPRGDAAWIEQRFPGKTPTEFSFERKEGREAVAVVARSSVSMKRQRVRVAPEALGKLRFSWYVPELIADADMALRDRDDSTVRVVLVFEGDRSRLTARDVMLSELSRAITGEELPYATLMYVWCNRREPGSVIENPRTSRIRKLVVESGRSNLGRWMDYERDIRADFERAFGEAPGALVGIGIMTDTDNTRSQARAWYGPIHMSRAEFAAR